MRQLILLKNDSGEEVRCLIHSQASSSQLSISYFGWRGAEAFDPVMKVSSTELAFDVYANPPGFGYEDSIPEEGEEGWRWFKDQVLGEERKQFGGAGLEKLVPLVLLTWDLEVKIPERMILKIREAGFDLPFAQVL